MSSMPADPSFNPALASITCFSCGRDHAVGELHTVCETCGLPLRVDMTLTPQTAAVDAGEPSMWRYGPVLPVAVTAAVTLGEGWTPLVEVEPGLWVKDEAVNPTASFKARGMAMAVSAARALGVERLVAPSAGNAAGALAAYGAAAGIPVLVAIPDDTPPAFAAECRDHGAEVVEVPGTIADAGAWLASHSSHGDFDVSTLKEPYRIEGKKTMAYELFEQFGDDLPDVIVYPTGGGTGLVGMAKAFDEMEAMGWIRSARPRLVSVQAAGCAPVVRAWDQGSDRTEPWPAPSTAAYGLRVPSPIGGFLCLRALRRTGGTAVAVPEEEIASAAAELSTLAGVDACPEAGAAWAATVRLRRSGWITPDDRVVVFNTGAGAKYRTQGPRSGAAARYTAAPAEGEGHDEQSGTGQGVRRARRGGGHR